MGRVCGLFNVAPHVGNWLLSNWAWNLAPVLKIIQMISENYCPCLYPSTGHF